MSLASILHSSDSVVHLAAVLLALASGTAVLVRPKGTPAHRRLGWAYVASMAVGLLTAFRLYYLFGRFGLVHWGALGSAGTLLVGTGAAVFRRVVPSWLRWHYLGMGASVIGLYAALAAEGTYRLLPPQYFWWATLGPAGVVFLAGSLLLYRHYIRPPL